MDLILKNKQDIKEEALRMFDILRLPDWVKEAYKDDVLCATFPEIPPYSAVLKEGTTEYEEAKEYIERLPNDYVPYYIVIGKDKRGNRGYFILTIPQMVEDGSDPWHMMEFRASKKGWVNCFVGSHGILEKGTPSGFPLKWTPLNINMGGEDRSCIKLDYGTEEEYKKLGIVFR